MLVETRYYLRGFYASLFLYMTIFAALIYVVGKSNVFLQRFTSKENFLNIMIVEKPQEVQQVIKTSETTVLQSSTSAAASAKTQTTGVQDLFKTINAEKLDKIGSKASTPSRLNGNSNPQTSASQLIDKLDFKQQRALVVIESSSGIYDPFIGKIQDTLDEKWQNTVHTVSGAQAEVEIGIDNHGGFSYYIVKPSYNDNFNYKLQSFLENMKDEVFPPYEGVGLFTLRTIFKDSEG